MGISILHLSDLHYSKNNHPKLNARDIKIVFEALLKDLKSIEEKEKIKPDIIIFSGDFVYEGDLGYSKERNDFDDVINLYINPLLLSLGLDNSHLFICAGNHDIQRSQVNRYLEDGLRSNLKNREEVNFFIDNILEHKTAFDRMGNYFKFRANLLNDKYLISENELYSTYIVPWMEWKIGIACFNSSWRAYGGEEDYGKLVLGERTINNALEDIKTTHVRIGVIHHPFEYLHEFERNELKRLITSGFQLWLSGHTHNPETNLTELLNESEFVMVSAGALYYSRDYYNGYSIINYSLEENSIKIFLREYTDRAKKFIPAETYAKDGIIEYKLNRDKYTPIDADINSIYKLKEKSIEKPKEVLIPSRGKSMQEIFVEPRIASDPDYKTRSMLDIEEKSVINITVDEIIASKDNYLLLGDKEYGKTTLLNHIYDRYLIPKTLVDAPTPIFVSFKHLPNGKEKIKKLISNFLIDNDLNIKVETVLEKNWVLLVDDLNIKNKAEINALSEFIEKYPDKQYIITIDKSTIQEIKESEDLSLPIKYKKFYIHPFGRKEIRKLIGNWFKHSENNSPSVNELTDIVIKKIDDFSLPRTPFIISALLAVIEEKRNFNPINKALLIENIIELLLEKLQVYSSLPEGLDYRNIEHYLSYLAFEMTKDKDSFDETEISTKTKEYFTNNSISNSIPTNLLTNFLVSRGILHIDKGKFGFRFKSFTEFFLAKFMRDNTQFYKEAISPKNYLKYAASIDYLTGLQRNNVEILALLQKQIIKKIDQKLKVNGISKFKLSLFDQIQFEKNIIETTEGIDKEIFLKNLKKSKISEEVKDDIDDFTVQEIENISKNKEEVDIPELSEEEKEKILKENELDIQILGTLELFANVIKNCEFIDDKEVKRSNFKTCIDATLKYIYINILESEGLVDNLSDSEISEIFKTSLFNPNKDNFEISENDNKELSPQQQREILKNTSKPLYFMLLQTIIFDSLGSPKLKILLDEELKDEKGYIVEKLIYTMIYADIRLPDFVSKFESITKKVINKKYYRNLLLRKLMSIYSNAYLSNADASRLENLIADIHIAEEGQAITQGTKKIQKSQRLSQKGNIINNLSRERLSKKYNVDNN